MLACLLSLLLLMLGAGRPTGPTGTVSVDTEPTAVSQPVIPKGAPYNVRPLYRSEYSLEVMEQWVDLDTFISAEMLESRFGNFDRFIFDARLDMAEPPFTGHTLEEIYTDCYMYYYEKETGGKYDLRIMVEKLQADGVERHTLRGDETISSSDIDPCDLRTAAKPGSYWAGNIEYYYLCNEAYDPQRSFLSEVTWKGYGYVFNVDIDERYVQEYSLEDGSFMAQMLRQETAPQAVAEFYKDILSALFGEVTVVQGEEAPTDNDPQPIVPVMIITIAVIGTTALIAFLLIRRRRKRKATVAAPIPEETPPEQG